MHHGVLQPTSKKASIFVLEQCMFFFLTFGLPGFGVPLSLNCPRHWHRSGPQGCVPTYPPVDTDSGSAIRGRLRQPMTSAALHCISSPPLLSRCNALCWDFKLCPCSPIPFAVVVASGPDMKCRQCHLEFSHILRWLLLKVASMFAYLAPTPSTNKGWGRGIGILQFFSLVCCPV